MVYDPATAKLSHLDTYHAVACRFSCATGCRMPSRLLRGEKAMVMLKTPPAMHCDPTQPKANVISATASSAPASARPSRRVCPRSPSPPSDESRAAEKAENSLFYWLQRRPNTSRSLRWRQVRRLRGWGCTLSATSSPRPGKVDGIPAYKVGLPAVAVLMCHPAQRPRHWSSDRHYC